jgi:redox-sensing transcriptional repressor
MRALLTGLEAQGWDRVTSRDLGRWIGATPDTIRKDLAGTSPGTPGAAYDVSDLLRRLTEFLPRPQARKTVLVGLGTLGISLAGAGDGPGGPWTFVAGFDGRPNRLEQVDLPFPVHPSTEIVPICLRLGIEAAVLAVGPSEAQRVAERFVQAGVRVLVNYASTVLRVDRNRVEVWEFGGTL